MIKIIKLFSLILVAAMLSACGSVEIQKVPVYVWAYPPDELIVNCPIKEPPFTIDEYVVMTDEQREKMLHKYLGTMMETVIICNKPINGIRAWKAERIKSQASEQKP